jgi:hypothetical protein
MKCYESDTIALIIAGMGAHNTLIATTYLLTKYPTDKILNIGIAGSTDKSLPIGSWYRINQIYHEKSQKYFYPDMIYQSELEESSLATVDRPLNKSDSIAEQIPTQLVDMEASHFFEAASRFLTNERIFVLKMVSDYLDPTSVNPDKITRLIGTAINMLDFHVNIKIVDNELLSQEEKALLTTISTNLNLTQTQSQQLKDATIYIKLNRGEHNLSSFIGLVAEHKQDRAKKLQEVIDAL